MSVAFYLCFCFRVRCVVAFRDVSESRICLVNANVVAGEEADLETTSRRYRKKRKKLLYAHVQRYLLQSNKRSRRGQEEQKGIVAVIQLLVVDAKPYTWTKEGMERAHGRRNAGSGRGRKLEKKFAREEMSHGARKCRPRRRMHGRRKNG